MTNPVLVKPEQLPIACPNPTMPAWNGHPKVFIKLDEHGAGRCHYCGTQYQVDGEIKHSH